MIKHATTCKRVNVSFRMTKAKTVPKREKVTKITPVFIDPISLSEKKK